ncbi:MAG: hypothetical protein ACSLFC_10190, partial [Desulfuromonadales bacterium]
MAKTRSVDRIRPTLMVLLSSLFGVFLLLSTELAAAIDVPLRSIAQIRVDDDGRPLMYPYTVFFDPVEEEIYLI